MNVEKHSTQHRKYVTIKYTSHLDQHNEFSILFGLVIHRIKSHTGR